MFIASLNSGSNGNCYYIGTTTEAVLVDAGISCREIEKRMKRLNLNMQHIKAVFISHEHSDHINGLATLSAKYRLPVYISNATLLSSRLQLQSAVKGFACGDSMAVGDLTITAFSKKHDAADPYSFVVSCGGINIGVFTDIGSVCSKLTRHFSTCHAAFLESNYDENMLESGNYPHFLKQRIRGGWGHLSNREALEVFQKHRAKHLSHLLLAHLSKNNNDPVLATQLFTPHAAGVKIVIAPRHTQSEVYHITAPEIKQRIMHTKPVQMALF
ncbi:MBL fold metallo-hydrolase [soil metagenome]